MTDMTSTRDSVASASPASPASLTRRLQPLPDDVQRCVEYMRGRTGELGADDMSLDDLVAISGLPREQISRAFRQSLGLRPLEVALLLRLDRSLTLLEHTELPVAEIAALCGFRGAPHYLKVFWFAFSTSPIHYREAAACGRTERLRSAPLRELVARQILRGRGPKNGHSLRACMDTSAARESAPLTAQTSGVNSPQRSP